MQSGPIPGVTSDDVAAGRRPRNRRQTIAKVAAALIADQGFSVVRMDDIAEANGVTVRALYRHFDNKLALLTELVESSQERFLLAVADASQDEVDPSQRFAVAVERMANASTETAHFAVLWQREARHLEADDYARMRGRLTAMVASIAEMVGHIRPELSPFQRELHAWSAIAVMVAPRGEDGTAAAIEAAMTLIGPREPVDLPVEAMDSAAVAHDETVSRRERLLASALVAFARNGFIAAGIEEIGRPAGVSGPSLYRHFSSKTELLDTLLLRREAWLWYEAHSRLTSQQSPLERLRALSTAYVASAVRAPDLVGAWLADQAQASAETRQTVGASLSAYHSTWASALHAVRSDLDATTCSLLVTFAVQIVDDISRIRHLHRDPSLAGELASIVESVLLQPQGGPRPS